MYNVAAKYLFKLFVIQQALKTQGVVGGRYMETVGRRCVGNWR